MSSLKAASVPLVTSVFLIFISACLIALSSFSFVFVSVLLCLLSVLLCLLMFSDHLDPLVYTMSDTWQIWACEFEQLECFFVFALFE